MCLLSRLLYEGHLGSTVGVIMLGKEWWRVRDIDKIEEM